MKRRALLSSSGKVLIVCIICKFLKRAKIPDRGGCSPFWCHPCWFASSCWYGGRVWTKCFNGKRNERRGKPRRLPNTCTVAFCSSLYLSVWPHLEYCILGVTFWRLSWVKWNSAMVDYARQRMNADDNNNRNNYRKQWQAKVHVGDIDKVYKELIKDKEKLRYFLLIKLCPNCLYPFWKVFKNFGTIRPHTREHSQAEMTVHWCQGKRKSTFRLPCVIQKRLHLS